METRINIAEILRNKPSGIKLYSPIFGDCTFCYVREDTNDICVKKHNGVIEYFNYEGLYFALGEVMLFPSKEMRDWSKFFNKGDVLVCYEGNNSYYTIFDCFESDTYKDFKGKFSYDNYKDKWYQNEGNLSTNTFHKLSIANSEIYITKIEERFGGKINHKTLDIEKNQPEFQDGDIVAVDLDRKNIRIFKEKKNENNICWGKYYIGFSFNNEGKRIQTFKNYTADCSSDRLATEEEKKQLFSALEKEGKAWDSDKKAIVDLKPKYEFKPMDLCLMKYIGQYNNRGWELCQYAYTEHRVSSSGEQRDFYHSVGGEIYAECIPYNEDTKHLLGTRAKWKGGEQ